MSSAASGRYQSKLFNFIHQRSRWLSEKCARAFRQLQVTTGWTVQALLYPVYLLLSTEPPVLHSFKQHGPQPDANSQLPTPTADTPIQRVLVAASILLEEPTATLQNKTKPLNLLASNALIRLTSLARLQFFKIIRKSSSNSTHSSPLNASQELSPQFAPPHFSSEVTTHKRQIIQGIATQLSTCTLVLVTAQNEVLDILTPEQQQRLQQRIIGEVAEYWRYWRLADVQPSTERGNLLLPLQGLQQLTGWAQTVSIALFTLPRKIAASLLQQESSLIRRQSEAMQASLEEAELIVRPYGALTFLDRTVAELESSIVPVSQAAIALTQRSRKLIQTLQQFSVPWLGKVQQVSNLPHSRSTTDRTLRIQALIWRAIEYFFGDRHEKLGQTASKQTGLPQRQAHLHSTQLSFLVNADEDPWLTMSDLFDQSPPAGDLPVDQIQTDSQVSHTSEGQVIPANYLAGSIWNAMRRLSNRYQRSPQPPSELAAQNGGVATESHSPSSQIDHAPDWIETPATAMGYVKHPLEKLLDWLDRAMLWLEKVLVGVWQWIVATR